MKPTLPPSPLAVRHSERPGLLAWVLVVLLVLFYGGRVFPADKTPRHGYAMGWKGDAPGKKSTPFSLHPGYRAMRIATASDLTPNMPAIRDQSTLGSCTGFGIARALDYAHRKRTGMFYTPSPLFIYWNERDMEGTVGEDAGAQIHDGITVVRNLGAPPECCWVYRTDYLTVRPHSKAFSAALNFQALHAYKLDNTDGRSIRTALSNGFPVIVGSLVYAGIEDLGPGNDILPMPRKGERPIGGHCYVLKAHDDAAQLYGADNSWGRNWGRNGSFRVPYAYIHNGRITEDCWVIDSAE